MKKFKKLFEKNLFVRYSVTFFSVILIIALLLIIEKSIPNTSVQKNLVKSNEYYYNYFDKIYTNLDELRDKHNMVDIPGDFYHYGILYLEDNKHPIKGFIEMNKDSNLDKKVMYHFGFGRAKIDSDYSRYWNAHLIVLKPLLSFFTIGTIFNIYYVLLIIAFLALLICVLKHSKLLAVILTLAGVSINMFMMAKCDNFFHVTMIALISSIIIIKMYERKSKNVDLLFLINGTLTACFDMLSCGTLPVTLPLFIYVYLHIKDGKTFKFRLLIRYILLWLAGGVLAYVVKWIILVIHYHGGLKEHVLDQAKMRIGGSDSGRLALFADSMSRLPGYFYPFNMDWLYYILGLLGIGSFFYVLKEKKTRKNYLFLLAICSIPFIRYLFLAEHSNYHDYFTYRAFMPVVMFALLFICLATKKLYKKVKKA